MKTKKQQSQAINDRPAPKQPAGDTIKAGDQWEITMDVKIPPTPAVIMQREERRNRPSRIKLLWDTFMNRYCTKIDWE